MLLFLLSKKPASSTGQRTAVLLRSLVRDESHGFHSADPGCEGMMDETSSDQQRKFEIPVDSQSSRSITCEMRMMLPDPIRRFPNRQSSALAG
jgi:hypothetical protein